MKSFVVMARSPADEPEPSPDCHPGEHIGHSDRMVPSAAALERAARLFRAVSDEHRLRLLSRLASGEHCVSALAEAEGEALSTISQRLRILRDERLIVRRREGRHVTYALADGHVMAIVMSAIDHANEPPASSAPQSHVRKEVSMGPDHVTHPNHPHVHGAGCGHTAVKHAGHVDYLHDGHLHHPHEGHVDEHVIAVDAANPATCTPNHACGGHEAGHVHGPGCGHDAVPHGDHVDYLVNGHLHHPHGGHCDDHGPLVKA